MIWKDREKESIRAHDPERLRTRETGELPSSRSETRMPCKVKRDGEKGNKRKQGHTHDQSEGR